MELDVCAQRYDFGFDKVKERIWLNILPEYQRVLFGNTDSEYLFDLFFSEMVRRGASVDGRVSFQHQIWSMHSKSQLTKYFSWAEDQTKSTPQDQLYFDKWTATIC